MTTGSSKVKFDGTITAGHLLQLFVILGAISAAYVTLKVTDADHESRISSLEQRAAESAATNQEILRTLFIIREDIATLKERTSK